MKDIKALIEQYANDNQVSHTQALRFLISSIKQVCRELDIDFDTALDKSEMELVPDECDHIRGHPSYDSIFCPDCNDYVIKGKMKMKSWVKENLWRVVPT